MHPETYILYNGKTVESDLEKLTEVLEEARMDERFNETILVNGPGGNADTAVLLANLIEDEGLDTIVGGGCFSACSLMWVAGNERYLFGDDPVVGFHFAYIQDVDAIEKLKEAEGWLGLQSYTAKTTHYYTSEVLRHGVNDPSLFVYNMAKFGSHKSFYEITKDNLDVIGGLVWEDTGR